MPALFDIDLRASEASDEEIAQTLFRAFEIVRRIHWPQDVISRNLPVKCIGEALESFLADR